MRILFRAPTDFRSRVIKDLSRSHPHAAERVGFISVRASMGLDHLVLLAEDYFPVADEHYIPSRSVGALIGQEAFRKILEISLLKSVGIFHVHMHDFPGVLRFSPTDLREQDRFVPDFFGVQQGMPHGAIVFGRSAALGRVWLSRTKVESIGEFNWIGHKVEIHKPGDSDGLDVYA